MWKMLFEQAMNFSVGSTGHFCGDKGLRNDGCIENDPIKGKIYEVRQIVSEIINIGFFRCYFLLLYQKLVQPRTNSHEVIHHSAKKNH